MSELRPSFPKLFFRRTPARSVRAVQQPVQPAADREVPIAVQLRSHGSPGEPGSEASIPAVGNATDLGVSWECQRFADICARVAEGYYDRRDVLDRTARLIVRGGAILEDK
jgi:hypothetical protein